MSFINLKQDNLEMIDYNGECAACGGDNHLTHFITCPARMSFRSHLEHEMHFGTEYWPIYNLDTNNQ